MILSASKRTIKSNNFSIKLVKVSSQGASSDVPVQKIMTALGKPTSPLLFGCKD
jgi:hypothetical protein